MSDDAGQSAELGLREAYSVETPDDNRALYQGWAPTYESGFIQYMGYVYHRTVADLFVAHRGNDEGRVADIGCGTGVVGEELRRRKIAHVDGIDISPAMLEQAMVKTTSDGEPIFDELIAADLNEALPIEDDRYSGVVSAGTFTHGHVGPDAFDELLRVAAPGALFALGINAEHFANRGFRTKFDELVQQGTISDPDLIDVAIYEDSTDPEHANDRALIAIFRSVGTPGSPA
jgi:predicted TPR repeat methyltransferase